MFQQLLLKLEMYTACGPFPLSVDHMTLGFGLCTVNFLTEKVDGMNNN